MQQRGWPQHDSHKPAAPRSHGPTDCTTLWRQSLALWRQSLALWRHSWANQPPSLTTNLPHLKMVVTRSISGSTSRTSGGCCCGVPPAVGVPGADPGLPTAACCRMPCKARAGGHGTAQLAYHALSPTLPRHSSCETVPLARADASRTCIGCTTMSSICCTHGCRWPSGSADATSATPSISCRWRGRQGGLARKQRKPSHTTGPSQ